MRDLRATLIKLLTCLLSLGLRTNPLIRTFSLTCACFSSCESPTWLVLWSHENVFCPVHTPCLLMPPCLLQVALYSWKPLPAIMYNFLLILQVSAETISCVKFSCLPLAKPRNHFLILLEHFVSYL